MFNKFLYLFYNIQIKNCNNFSANKTYTTAFFNSNVNEKRKKYIKMHTVKRLKEKFCIFFNCLTGNRKLFFIKIFFDVKSCVLWNKNCITKASYRCTKTTTVEMPSSLIHIFHINKNNKNM